jgi:Galactose oxidase, central domain
MKKILLVLLFLPVIGLAQQKLSVSEGAKMVFNRYDQTYFVIDDSSSFYTYALNKKVWKRNKLEISELGFPFADFLARFYPIAIDKGHYYFVMDGCGLVFELKKGKLRRIDQSYDQKNQFASAIYEFRHKVYMFGGYGLFEVKNTHTFYEPVNKEWFQVERQTKACPSPRSNPFRVKQRAKLYILGGIQQDFNKVKRLNDIWAFDMKTKKWELMGELSPDFVNRTRIRGFVQNKDYSIFTYNNKLTMVQLDANKYYTYTSATYWNISRIIPSYDRNYLLVARHNSNRANNKVITIKRLNEMLIGVPKENFLYRPISEFKLIPSETYLWLSIILNIVLIFLLFYIRRITKTARYKPKNPELTRSDFTELEWVIIQLISHQGELELSALNDYFDEPGLSYETLKKRRESFLRALRIKLALITRRDVEDLLPESKHPLDKRMKIIKWNNELVISEEDNIS